MPQVLYHIDSMGKTSPVDPYSVESAEHDPKTFVRRLPCNPCKELFGNQVSWISFEVPSKGAHRCLGHQVRLDHMPKAHSRIWQPRMLKP